MLSLSPRYDLFRFRFPKDFLSDEIYQKYSEFLNKRKHVILDPIEFLNECVQGVQFFGVSGVSITQQQTYKNPNIGRIEPAADYHYRSPGNVLSYLSKEFIVTMRHTTAFVSYFMAFEEFFHSYAKETTPQGIHWKLEILNENGNVISAAKVFNPVFTGMDNIELTYNKTQRDLSTFQLTFAFSNLDLEFYETTETPTH